jgi:hypothetical protein
MLKLVTPVQLCGLEGLGIYEGWWLFFTTGQKVAAINDFDNYN